MTHAVEYFWLRPWRSGATGWWTCKRGTSLVRSGLPTVQPNSELSAPECRQLVVVYVEHSGVGSIKALNLEIRAYVNSGKILVKKMKCTLFKVRLFSFIAMFSEILHTTALNTTFWNPTMRIGAVPLHYVCFRGTLIIENRYFLYGTHLLEKFAFSWFFVYAACQLT